MLFVGVGYLLTVALGYALVRGRPIVGAVGVIVALALARAAEVLKARVR